MIRHWLDKLTSIAQYNERHATAEHC